MVKIAIVRSSMSAFIVEISKAVKEGVESVDGAVCDIYQAPESLPEVLTNNRAPTKGDYPIMTPDRLTEYDGILFGCADRGGETQMKTFMDSTGSLWQQGALVGKSGGIFVCTNTRGGGKDTINYMVEFMAHHSMVVVPLGYVDPAVFAVISDGTLASPFAVAWWTGMNSNIDKKSVAKTQGKHFAGIAAKLAT